MRERAAALVFLAGGAAYLVASLAFPFGTAARPGPGFYPVAVGVFLCAAGAVFAATALWRAPAAARSAPAPIPGGGARVATTIVMIVAFVFLLPWAGYPAVAALLVAVLLRRLGGSRWIVAVLVGVGAAVLTYWVFGRLLGVPLPAGPLD